MFFSKCRLISVLPRISAYSTAAESTVKPKTAIVMLNMGGPETTDQVADYLLRIMTDRDMIQLPVQSKLGPWIATRRTEEVKKKVVANSSFGPNVAGVGAAQALCCVQIRAAFHG
ncbi:hypothetical protein O3G_MSEX000197 [Manduca sexta]|nr:hypothetical protein O3G_MSEX000197 [Manduca sexta]